MTIASFDFAGRRAKAQEAVRAANLDALIVTPGVHFNYLTGREMDTHERLSALVVPAEGECFIVVPKVDVSPDLMRTLRWGDGEDPYRLIIGELFGGQHESAAETARIGVVPDMTADHLMRFQSRVASTVLFSSFFMIKDEEEINQLRAAGKAIDEVHAKVPALLRAGRTEREVADDIEKLIFESGHTAIDFIIVGSGPNGANPHHDFSDRVLEAGDPVVIDIGGTWGDGYHSDSTRTHVVPGAEPTEEFKNLASVLYKAQVAAVEAARPGMTAGALDAVARDIIEKAGYGEAYFHRTGHGIGLSTHEEPFIIAGSDVVLEPGMTFSIEPGIYLEGKYGARIEDIVLITEDGCERLNTQPRKVF
ncbi:MAG: Xaa-Pro peptidase family protein [Corynebacterium sp.]|nr:Xaa-Pro peptidase family protein [Corynebacterium sp.]